VGGFLPHRRRKKQKTRAKKTISQELNPAAKDREMGGRKPPAEMRDLKKTRRGGGKREIRTGGGLFENQGGKERLGGAAAEKVKGGSVLLIKKISIR